MKIIIETIPHNEQRYPTVGDWYWEPSGTILSGWKQETLRIKVSELSDWRREALIAIHELVEVLLCRDQGITQEDVDAFDIEFENNRKEGDESEPGDQHNAPYRREHCIATAVERLMAAELGQDWNSYATEVESLP